MSEESNLGANQRNQPKNQPNSPTVSRFSPRIDSHSSVPRTAILTLLQICKNKTRGKTHHQTARETAIKQPHPNPPNLQKKTHDLLGYCPVRFDPIPATTIPTIQPRFGWDFWVDFLGFVPGATTAAFWLGFGRWWRAAQAGF